jgi:acylphosphatase
MVLVRAHVFVTGRVQGVYYRSSTCDEARRTSVRGWVKNLSDGRVEAVFEGDQKDVAKMLLWCTHGPPAAEVTDLQTAWEEPTSEFDSFSIW